MFEDSNVREVLAALGDASATGETRLMHAPPPPRAAAREGDSLSDTQVLKMLETRRPEGGAPQPADLAHGGIPLLKPDDTGTRRALKEAVVNNAPVSFAVQLQWSVQPAELDKVPPLAIFTAYTLYTVEGSRDGRKWYGLRLGFFSDAISAKQVAHYVRSEFTSVLRRDGAQGLLQMRSAGSQTIAQDEASSVVWGMPGEAVALGGAADVLPLGDIYARVLALADEMDITRSTDVGLG